MPVTSRREMRIKCEIVMIDDDFEPAGDIGYAITAGVFPQRGDVEADHQAGGHEMLAGICEQ